MKGSVILIRGSDAAPTPARRGRPLSRRRVLPWRGRRRSRVRRNRRGGGGIDARSLSADEYEWWVDWRKPLTGESMGTPGKPGEGIKGWPSFAEMTINAPSSLSVGAALHPEVSAALEAAHQDAREEHLGRPRHESDVLRRCWGLRFAPVRTTRTAKAPASDAASGVVTALIGMKMPPPALPMAAPR